MKVETTVTPNPFILRMETLTIGGPTQNDKRLAQLITLVMENALELAKGNDIPDSQKKELNRSIRNAVLTCIHLVNNQKHPALKKYLEQYYTAVPDSWEDPELTDDYKEFLKSCTGN